MKTRKNILLIISLTILLSLHLNATISFFTGNSSTNDITKVEINESATSEDSSLAEFSFDDEEYIDDIPFDTDCVTAQCKYEKAMSVDFNFEDEEYIDDMNGLNI